MSGKKPKINFTRCHITKQCEQEKWKNMRRMWAGAFDVSTKWKKKKKSTLNWVILIHFYLSFGCYNIPMAKVV